MRLNTGNRRGEKQVYSGDHRVVSLVEGDQHETPEPRQG